MDIDERKEEREKFQSENLLSIIDHSAKMIPPVSLK